MAREKDREKFVELAEKRVSKALKDIKLIGNLSNKSNYDYQDQDVKKIYSTLKKALEEMKSRFDSKGSSDDEVFKL
jgi:formiminotetrahydrofolate cyclodeaminase